MTDRFAKLHSTLTVVSSARVEKNCECASGVTEVFISVEFCFQMAYLFVLWLSETAAEKVFTSLRLLLWSTTLDRLLHRSKNRFLIMVNRDDHHSLWNLLHRLNLMIEEEQHFLHILTDDQRQAIKESLKASKLISSDEEHRLMVNIEHVDADYLLKSSKETSSND